MDRGKALVSSPQSSALLPLSRDEIKKDGTHQPRKPIMGLASFSSSISWRTTSTGLLMRLASASVSAPFWEWGNGWGAGRVTRAVGRLDRQGQQVVWTLSD